jgi:hypothetical protein
MMTVTLNEEKTIRSAYQCWPDGDRTGLDNLIAEGFHFTSPLDNRLDRKTFFTRCWPNSEKMAAINIKHLLPQGNRAFVVYELRMKDGRRFRNAELVTIEGGKIKDIEVYFGWNLPHAAPNGGFVDQQKR